MDCGIGYKGKTKVKATGIVRPVDQLGRIVLPKSLRKNLDIKVDDPIEIFVEDEYIILQKYYPKCIFCESKENVKPFKNRYICQDCIEKLS